MPLPPVAYFYDAHPLPPFPSGAIGLWHAETATTTTGGVPYVPNLMSVTPASDSYIYASRRLFNDFIHWAAAGTITDNAVTGPDGLMEASTIVTSGSWEIFTRNPATNGSGIGNVPSGTYTLAVSLKSNSGSQTDLQFYNGNSGFVGSSFNITSSWARYTYTFTWAGGNLVVGIGNASAGNNIQICDFEMFAGSSDLGPVAKAGHMYLGSGPGAYIPGYGSNTGYLDFATNPSIALTQFYNSVANPVGAFTVSMLVNCVNYPQLSNTGTSVFFQTPDSTSLVCYSYYNTTTGAAVALQVNGVSAASVVSGGGLYPSAGAWWSNLKGNGFHVITFHYDGTNYRIIYDDVVIVFFTLSSPPANPVIGDWVWSLFGGGQPGQEFKIAAIAYWDSALTLTQIYNVVDTWIAKYSSFFTTGLHKYYAFAEGDSITSGTGATYSYPQYVNTLGEGTWPGSDFANENVFGANWSIGGSTIGSPGISFANDFATYRTTNLLACLPPASRMTGRTFAISLYFGQNDYQSSQGFSLDPTGALWITGTYEPYITSLTGVGGFNKVIVGTIFSPGGTGGSAETTDQFNWRTGANSYIYNFVTGGQANAIMDFNGNANLGAFQAGTNGTYFNLSSTPHPSTLSQETIMAPLYLTALNSVL